MIKDIAGYLGLYAITLDGRIWSYPRRCSSKKGKWLKPRTTVNGYLIVSLHKENKKYDKLIHRLVAEAFIPNPLNYPTVDHIDRNRLNNNISNLRWATNSMQHCNQDYRSEKWKESNKININKAQEAKKKKVRCIETNMIYESAREAQRQTGINNSYISKACSGNQKTAGKYHWLFVLNE